MSNSNWRGPVWMPVNALLVRALLRLFGTEDAKSILEEATPAALNHGS